MVCLYGTLPPFPSGKAFTLMALQMTRMKVRPHTVGGLPSRTQAQYVRCGRRRFPRVRLTHHLMERGGMPCQP
jgi:hypothetical protein